MSGDGASTHVLVVYATTFGNTRRMAEAVAEGVGSVPNARAVLKTAEVATQEDVRTADALILGSPMRHRNMDARIKLFIERVCEVLWLTDEMVGKVGGIFTVGGGYGDMGAGCEMAQLGMLANMAACGMILVTLPKTTPGFAAAGMHWGPNGRSGGPAMEPVGVTEEMLQTGFHHGANIARVAAELKAKELLAKGNVAPSPEFVRLFRGQN